MGIDKVNEIWYDNLSSSIKWFSDERIKKMLQYLTPQTLKEMYKDLDEARLDLVGRDRKSWKSNKEYHNLTVLVSQIEIQYKSLTGKDLWAEVALEDKQCLSK